MSRLTEYHCGTAVIKEKHKLSEAIHKLAIIEDLEEGGPIVQDTLKELRAHRDVFLKNSSSWGEINRAINLIIGMNVELEVLRKKAEQQEKDAAFMEGLALGKQQVLAIKENADGCVGCAFEDTESWQLPCSACMRNCKDYWRKKVE